MLYSCRFSCRLMVHKLWHSLGESVHLVTHAQNICACVNDLRLWMHFQVIYVLFTYFWRSPMANFIIVIWLRLEDMGYCHYLVSMERVHHWEHHGVIRMEVAQILRELWLHLLSFSWFFPADRRLDLLGQASSSSSSPLKLQVYCMSNAICIAG